MSPEIVGYHGALSQHRFPIRGERMTFGRGAANDVVITSPDASREHAEVRLGADGHVLRDLGSRNGTLVNGRPVARHVLQPGDLITIADDVFRFEAADPAEPVTVPLTSDLRAGVLNVTIAGGGPVGLSLALLLEQFLGRRVLVTVYDHRWVGDGSRVVWKDETQGNARRRQVVTIQSRQYLHLPADVQEKLFRPGSYSEMWPIGPDSVRGYGPRNVRIADVEDTLLEAATMRQGTIRLVPEAFNPGESRETLAGSHVLAICEGARSSTREYFSDRFGSADSSIYSLDGHHVQDVILGLRVRSRLPDPMIAALTVAQNRFLLNSLSGDGFLNMRLTPAEAREVIGIDPVRHVFEECVASSPCVMDRDTSGDFRCPTHGTLFLPALVKGSALWKRVREGLILFGVADNDLSAVTAFRLDMVQRPLFTAALRPATPAGPGTYGFLLGDAANAIHFWPGRGLNSGLASAVSLARTLRDTWRGTPFRDADFMRHEAAMSMLQYRHKSRAWRAMVTVDEHGSSRAIKDLIADSIDAAQPGVPDRNTDIETLLDRLRGVRQRLSSRIAGMPDDAVLGDHLGQLSAQTLRTLVASGGWDTPIVGGEEVDIDMFQRREPATSPSRAARPPTATTPSGGNRTGPPPRMRGRAVPSTTG
ncbi:FHA domain-containing protein [Catenuloplanes sp. NPDC051500]|uniref:FHA domain-containing protein n=1 Tax=Catenuloplanes sp. NPDC051500 TaxID=3363959 RepID=UPI0037877060